jgi:hypothetical protein
MTSPRRVVEQPQESKPPPRPKRPNPMVALKTAGPTALSWLILNDPVRRVQAQDRHLAGTLPVASYFPRK